MTGCIEKLQEPPLVLCCKTMVTVISAFPKFEQAHTRPPSPAGKGGDTKNEEADTFLVLTSLIGMCIRVAKGNIYNDDLILLQRWPQPIDF